MKADSRIDGRARFSGSFASKYIGKFIVRLPREVEIADVSACGLGLAVALHFFLVAVATAACATPAPPDEATLRTEDQRKLEQVVQIDVKASRAMRDVDEASRVGDAGAALSALSARAVPAVDEALRMAEGSSMKSEWGRTKRDELIGILRDRRAEMPTYEAAVRADDPEKLLPAIQAQAAIERRAFTTVAEVQKGR